MNTNHPTDSRQEGVPADLPMPLCLERREPGAGGFSPLLLTPLIQGRWAGAGVLPRASLTWGVG